MMLWLQNIPVHYRILISFSYPSSLIHSLVLTWQERFAHRSDNTILRMSALGLTDGLNLKNITPSHSLCVGCKLGKMTRLPFPIGRLRATTVGNLVHCNVCGPMKHLSPSGERYFVHLRTTIESSKAQPKYLHMNHGTKKDQMYLIYAYLAHGFLNTSQNHFARS